VVSSGCPSDTIGPDQLCAKGAVNDHQTTLQGKVGCLITVMDSSFTLISPYYHTNITFSVLYRAMKKPSGKTDLAIYSYSVVVSG